MTESSLLEVTAQVATAFTGFIGIFLILATRDSSGGRYDIDDAHRIKIVVSLSVLPVFYSIMPLVLHTLGASEPFIWQFSSIVMILVGIVVAPYFIGEALKLGGLFRFSVIGDIAAQVLGVAILISLVGNAISWPWETFSGPYILAVWLCLAIVASIFVELIFRKVL